MMMAQESVSSVMTQQQQFLGENRSQIKHVCYLLLQAFQCHSAAAAASTIIDCGSHKNGECFS